MELINNKYILLDKIGSGSFGSIYKGINNRTKEYVAIKIEPLEDDLKLLKNESKIYQYLNNCSGIPQVKWFGKDEKNYYMVINLLGHSLQNLIDKNKKFSLSLTLKIGLKLIKLIKLIHDKGLVHRDIKPDNFLFSLNQYNELYLIDFGFCKSYLEDNQHIKIKKLHNMIGSNNYASLSSHEHNELSRRDDIESICYMLLYFYCGTLPWKNISEVKIIVELKKNILNDKRYPIVLVDLLRYVRSMEFEEKPNYYLIMDNFKREIECLSKKV